MHRAELIRMTCYSMDSTGIFLSIEVNTQPKNLLKANVTPTHLLFQPSTKGSMTGTTTDCYEEYISPEAPPTPKTL